MKKTIAAGGASLLGIGAASLGVAAPAAAADVTTPCADYTDHAITVGALNSNWYMDCVPQYANAAADITIVSDTAFPAGFSPIDEPTVTRTATTGQAGADYWFSNLGFTYLSHFPPFDTPTSQTYDGDMIVSISSVDDFPVASLAGVGCTGTFSTGWVVNYAPTTVSFTQTVDGVEWRYDVTTSPEPLYLGLNILNTGVLDSAADQCASSNGFIENSVDGADPEFTNVEYIATTSLDPYFGDEKLIPDVSRYVPPLPATGMELQPGVPLGIAGLFLALGVAGGFLRKRRADAAE